MFRVHICTSSFQFENDFAHTNSNHSGFKYQLLAIIFTVYVLGEIKRPDSILTKIDCVQ